MATPQSTSALVSILQLEPNSHTCIGHAETLGRRCQNTIAYANRQEAADVLEDVARLDPQSPRLETKLEELASLHLCSNCNNRHQDQVAEIARQWAQDIRNGPRRQMNPESHCSSQQQEILPPASSTDEPTNHTIAQGLCVGLGMGLVYVPVLGEVSRHFTKRRPIALGLSSTGACFGGVLFPILVRQLLTKIGFAWTIRVVGFINLGCGLTASAIVCRGPHQLDSPRRLFDFTVFREVPFTLFTIGMFLVFVPYYVPLTYAPTFAQTAIGTSDDLAGYMLAIINAASLLGRTVPYILNSRVTPIRVFFVCIVAAVILLFGWMGVSDTSGFIVWCVFWGILSGAIATAPIAAVSHPVLTPSPGELGTRLGISLMVSSIGDAVGPSIMGALSDVSGGHFARAQAVSGAIMTLGGICILWPLIAISRSNQ